MKRQIFFRIFIGIVILFCLFAANIFQSSAALDVPASVAARASKAKIHGKAGDYDAKTPITVKISMSDLPVLNKPTEIFCTVSTVADAPDTTATIALPPDASLISGSTNWHGDLYAGQSVSFSATIKFQSGGKKIVRGLAKHIISQRESWGDLDTIYLNVGESKSVQGIYSPEEALELNRTQAGPSTAPDSQPQTPDAPLQYVDGGEGAPPALVVPGRKPAGQSQDLNLTGGSLTVTGKWSHYNLNGNLIPSRTFLVQLRRASDGAHLAFAYTDRSGNFTLGPVANPGSDGVRVRIWTYVKYDSADPTDDELMVVPNGSASSYTNTFYGETPVSYFADGTNSIGNWEISRDNPEGSRPNAHAWYIKDDLDRGWRYPPTAVGDCTVEWQFDSTVGTFYRRGEHVHLTGEDRNSPDTVLHEMGHNVMYNVYGNTFPTTDCPAPHYINASSGIVCAWTEGWANFYALVVNGDPVFTWPGGAALNLETPTWGSPNWDDGATVEGRVAGALWDIYDSSGDGYDDFSDGFGHIWTTFRTHVDSTFRHFWNDASGSGINTVGGADAIYQNTIDYRAIPTLTASLVLSPSQPYSQGQTVTGTFSLTNKGTSPITFEVITIGGRLDNDATVRDFPWHTNITLNAGEVYTYQDDFTLNEAGDYRFFPAFRTADGWRIGLLDEIPADPPGLVDLISFTVSSGCNAPGSFSLTSPTNGQVFNPTSSVTLSWGASANADSYGVYFGTTSNPGLLANQTSRSRSVTVTSGQTYYWKIVAKVSCDSSMTYTTAVRSFSVSTGATAPTVTTSAATSVTDVAATLKGTVNPNGSSTDGWFEWGTSPTLSNPNLTSAQALGSSGSVSLSKGISSLTPNTTYYYRAVGSNLVGTSSGTILSFTTKAASVSQWLPLGGWADLLAVASNSDGRLEAFVRGNDGVLYHRAQLSPTSNTWGAWSSLGGKIDRLAVARNKDGRLEVFVRGLDGALYHRAQVAANSNTWGNWSSLQGGIDHLAVVSNADGRLEVFARGGNGSLYHRAQVAPNSNTWGAWSSLGGWLDVLAVGSNADGRLEVFVRGQDRAVYRRAQVSPNSAAWGAWSSLGGGVDKLEVGRNADGRLEVFARGGDGALYHKAQVAPNSAAWGAWTSLGGWLDRLAVGLNSGGRLDVFGRGSDGIIYHRWQTAANSNSWSGWVSLNGAADNLAVGRNSNGYLDVFVSGNDHAIYHRLALYSAGP